MGVGRTHGPDGLSTVSGDRRTLVSEPRPVEWLNRHPSAVDTSRYRATGDQKASSGIWAVGVPSRSAPNRFCSCVLPTLLVAQPLLLPVQPSVERIAARSSISPGLSLALVLTRRSASSRDFTPGRAVCPGGVNQEGFCVVEHPSGVSQRLEMP